jgi:Ca2+-binding EF-hand superfamily protein
MIGARTTTNTNILDTNALAKLSPAQVRELREGFQILDRDGDGSVNREDVADMLAQLGKSLTMNLYPTFSQFRPSECNANPNTNHPPGLPATPSAISTFFPPSTPQTITLPHFLTTLSTLLSSLSPSSELLNAFAAFDDDDSGQIDLGELKDALLNTAPEPGEQPLTAREVEKVLSGFSGRRAFGGKSSVGGMGMHVAAPKRGEVFRYQEFVGAVAGGKGGKEDDA